MLTTLNLRIDREAQWYYHDSPILRKELVCLFAAALRRDADGGYWIVTPREMGPVEVEDAPFLAVELFVTGVGENQCLSIRTNVDEIAAIDQDHPVRLLLRPDCEEFAPYVRLSGGREARFTRAAYYQLADLAVEEGSGDDGPFGVWSNGRFFALDGSDPLSGGGD